MSKQASEKAISLKEEFIPQFLPGELRQLVRKATTALGKAIFELEGEKFFKKVEFYREQLKKTRSKSKVPEHLKAMQKKLVQENPNDLLRLAHAFSLQLELVNVCEAAYRTWKQRQKASPQRTTKKLNLTYVLTAHPTEARSRATVEILSLLHKLLVEGIDNRFALRDSALSTQMRHLWLQSIANKRKPTVLDEAEYIFSLVLKPDILDFILQEKPGYDLRLRTWVGGDKDGHPGVDSIVMRGCLNKSRGYLIEFATSKLDLILKDLTQLIDTDKSWQKEAEGLKSFRTRLANFQIIAKGDGDKILKWSGDYKLFLKKASLFVRDHEQILLLNRILELFPAFVLPIELREDSTLIQEALLNSKSQIREMLSEIAQLAGSLDLRFYARGLVVSNCENEQDIENAIQLVDLVCKKSSLPVIPLFESREALLAGKKILTNWLMVKKNHSRVLKYWNEKFEVMLGYSDSAKQTGALPSRLVIAKAMESIEATLKSFNIEPVFFHGSGGSVARGGGSLKEQISWWSESAIDNPKMTIQGEMIQRLFASKEILNSQCSHLTTESLRRTTKKLKLEKSPALEALTNQVMIEYKALVSDNALLTRLLKTTPYPYLEVLKIGSRPSKRFSSDVSLASLRAIPWVLCWTQTRMLLPSWWGVGSAWSKLDPKQKNELKILFKKDPFFSSFVKTLGYTLEKVELDIWELYFLGDKDKAIIERFRGEYKNATNFIRSLSGEKQLIWHRPWLEDSIRLRSSNIHLLNLIQIIAMKKSNEVLLKETIVGIACGMLTTG